jgi:VWFA-related protein
MAWAILRAACIAAIILTPPEGLAFQESFAAPRPAKEAPPNLRTDSSLVVIPIHVTTGIGASVTTLQRENFRLIDDDVEQPIAHFDRDDAPISIGVLFDSSGSMRPRMLKAAEAVASFFRTANTEDEFFLVQFSDKAKLVLPFTSDSESIYNRVAAIRPSGQTALFDAIHIALQQMKKARHTRKAIVIISDGGDNWSRHSAREIRNELVESDTQLYAMGIFDPDYAAKGPAETRKGPGLLDELAGLTGGRHYPVGNLDDLPAISAKIGNDLRNEYLLGYYPSIARDGKYHKVKVNVAEPEGMSGLRTYYRRGYYAPSQ